MLPQTVMLWSRLAFLKLILRLETKPVANRQFTHLSGWLATSSGLILIGSYFIILQIIRKKCWNLDFSVALQCYLLTIHVVHTW